MRPRDWATFLGAWVGAGQTIAVSVACYPHPDVIGFPPDPCTGMFMLHAQNGKVLASSSYSVPPGRSANLRYKVPAGGSGLNINPCVIPAADSGIGVPAVSVFGGDGAPLQTIGPASAHVGDFARAE